jgi:hypothetical protein
LQGRKIVRKLELYSFVFSTAIMDVINGLYK